MRLLDANGLELLVNDNISGANLCSRLSSPRGPGTYFIQVNDVPNDGVIPGYSLRIEVN